MISQGLKKNTWYTPLKKIGKTIRRKMPRSQLLNPSAPGVFLSRKKRPGRRSSSPGECRVSHLISDRYTIPVGKHTNYSLDERKRENKIEFNKPGNREFSLCRTGIPSPPGVESTASVTEKPVAVSEGKAHHGTVKARAGRMTGRNVSGVKWNPGTPAGIGPAALYRGPA